MVRKTSYPIRVVTPFLILAPAVNDTSLCPSFISSQDDLPKKFEKYQWIQTQRTRKKIKAVPVQNHFLI